MYQYRSGLRKYNSTQSVLAKNIFETFSFQKQGTALQIHCQGYTIHIFCIFSPSRLLHKLSNQDMIHYSISAIFRFLLKPTVDLLLSSFLLAIYQKVIHSSLPTFLIWGKKMAPIFQTNPIDHIQIILWNSQGYIKFWKKDPTKMYFLFIAWRNQLFSTFLKIKVQLLLLWSLLNEDTV